MSLDVVISVVITGVFPLGAGILIAWRLRNAQEPSRRRLEEIASLLSRLRESLLTAANEDLAPRLRALSELREQLERTPRRDVDRLTVCFDSLVEQVEEVMHILDRSQQAIRTANFRLGVEFSVAMPQVNSDVAGLASKKWFPQGRSENPPRANELRKAHRFPYHHAQPIAPCDGDALTDPTSFFDVQFRDISTEGFSFDVPQRLTFDRLVARLGVEPDVVVVQAKVVHQTDFQTGDTSIVHVGCQILKRL